MSDDDNVIPFGRRPASGDVVDADVGGLVDECSLTLAVYGVDLDPDAVTAKLGIQPTSAHRRGERRQSRSVPYRGGAWLLERRGVPPRGPEELLAELLEVLPAEHSPVWAELRAQYDVQLRYGLFVKRWNSGFGLSSALVQRISSVVGRFEIVIDAETDDE